MNPSPRITWDIGSAYDLFISIWVIHQPDDFGLRPSWAAGVRSRIPPDLREVLEQAQKCLPMPLQWIYSLPKPKDARTALKALKALPAEDILLALSFTGLDTPEMQDCKEFMISLDGKQRFTTHLNKKILEKTILFDRKTKGFSRTLFTVWSNRKAFGEKFIEALEVYFENFYLSEEERITPYLEQALAEAQTISEELKDISALMEELSSGIRLDWISEADHLVLSPSFWCAPYMLFDNVHSKPQIILFGKRPKGTTLVPGEQIPEELINGLKAMSDPTRLYMIKLLMKESYTPSELAKLLRLRPPTVIHHLHKLRLAGFVLVTISPNSEHKYTIRNDGVLEIARILHTFLLEE